MSIKCLMNGLEVNYPCSPVCALFGDCVTAFEAQKKENVRTNADRIRAMSDEELADMINNFDFCSLRTNEECRISYCSVCSQCVLDWLRDPVPVEGGPTDV